MAVGRSAQSEQREWLHTDDHIENHKHESFKPIGPSISNCVADDDNGKGHWKRG